MHVYLKMVFITRKVSFINPDPNLHTQTDQKFLKSESKIYCHNYSAFGFSFIRNRGYSHLCVLFVPECFQTAGCPPKWTLWLLPHMPLTFDNDPSIVWVSHSLRQPRWPHESWWFGVSASSGLEFSGVGRWPNFSLRVVEDGCWYFLWRKHTRSLPGSGRESMEPRRCLQSSINNQAQSITW